MSHLYNSLPVSPALEACVIVPARNESARLSAALKALASQKDLDGKPLRRERWEVLLLVNNSTDNSWDLACQFKQAHPWFPLQIAECNLPAHCAHIGHVRKLLLDSAYERLCRHEKASSLMLSTDADTEVASDWIAQNLAESRMGAEAVGGRITVQPNDLQQWDPQTRKIQAYDDQYHLLLSWLEDFYDPQAHDSWPRHHQHFGSSLAIKPETYKYVGGLPAKECLEDVALYEALIRHDKKFRHSPVVHVLTSGRMQGRTTVGLAEQLSQWSRGPSTIFVPSVFLCQTLFSLRGRLRALWRGVQESQPFSPSILDSLSQACHAERSEVYTVLTSQWFGAAFEAFGLCQRLEAGLLSGKTMQPLDQAVCELQKLFGTTCPTSLDVCAVEDQSGIVALETE